MDIINANLTESEKDQEEEKAIINIDAKIERTIELMKQYDD